jgi:WD40 repeat protein
MPQTHPSRGFAPVTSVALSADGKFLATASGTNVLRLWDTATGKLFQEFQAQQGHDVISLSVSADNKLLATGSSDGTARLWDIGTGKEIRVFQK